MTWNRNISKFMKRRSYLKPELKFDANLNEFSKFNLLQFCSPPVSQPTGANDRRNSAGTFPPNLSRCHRLLPGSSGWSPWLSSDHLRQPASHWSLRFFLLALWHLRDWKKFWFHFASRMIRCGTYVEFSFLQLTYIYKSLISKNCWPILC